MSEINAGVVVVTKFVDKNTPQGKKAFSGYINYLNRDEATRNDNFQKYNLFTDYNDYMSNSKKTTGLFTNAHDSLTSPQKTEVKKLFETAYNNDSIMWQTVISFDNSYLAELGIYNPSTAHINEKQLKNVTRNMMNNTLKNENLAHSAIWSAAIHYNTDNVHIHVAFTEPLPTREKREINGIERPIGHFSAKTLRSMKSSVVNTILDNDYKLINDYIRNKIIAPRKEFNISENKELYKHWQTIYNKLPGNKRLWNYNITAIQSLIPDIDKLTSRYIETYHGKEYNALLHNLKKQENIFKTAYGHNSKYQDYTKNKLNDLFSRMGNTVLKEMRKHSNESLAKDAAPPTHSTIATTTSPVAISLSELEAQRNSAGNEFSKELYKRLLTIAKGGKSYRKNIYTELENLSTLVGELSKNEKQYILLNADTKKMVDDILHNVCTDSKILSDIYKKHKTSQHELYKFYYQNSSEKADSKIVLWENDFFSPKPKETKKGVFTKQHNSILNIAHKLYEFNLPNDSSIKKDKNRTPEENAREHLRGELHKLLKRQLRQSITSELPANSELANMLTSLSYIIKDEGDNNNYKSYENDTKDKVDAILHHLIENNEETALVFKQFKQACINLYPLYFKDKEFLNRKIDNFDNEFFDPRQDTSSLYEYSRRHDYIVNTAWEKYRFYDDTRDKTLLETNAEKTTATLHQKINEKLSEIIKSNGVLPTENEQQIYITMQNLSYSIFEEKFTRYSYLNDGLKEIVKEIVKDVIHSDSDIHEAYEQNKLLQHELIEFYYNNPETIKSKIANWEYNFFNPEKQTDLLYSDSKAHYSVTSSAWRLFTFYDKERERTPLEELNSSLRKSLGETISQKLYTASISQNTVEPTRTTLLLKNLPNHIDFNEHQNYSELSEKQKLEISHVLKDLIRHDDDVSSIYERYKLAQEELTAFQFDNSEIAQERIANFDKDFLYSTTNTYLQEKIFNYANRANKEHEPNYKTSYIPKNNSMLNKTAYDINNCIEKLKRALQNDFNKEYQNLYEYEQLQQAIHYAERHDYEPIE